MQIRTATIHDAPAIARIHVETWQTAYRGQMPDAVLDALNVEQRLQFWQNRIAQTKGSILVTEDDDAVVGFCEVLPPPEGNENPLKPAEITTFYVQPKSWRTGVGRKLCESALNEARKLGGNEAMLWTLATNARAIQFYKAMGFVQDGNSKTDTRLTGVELDQVRFSKQV